MRRTTQLFVLLALLSFVGSFTWILHTLQRVTPRTSPQPFISQIQANTEFIRMYVYEDGSQGPSSVIPILYEWIGLTASEFAERYPQWRVVSFSPRQVVIEEPCTIEDDTGFIRLEGNMISIYRGDVQGCHRREDVLSIRLDGISPFHKMELTEGISFHSSTERSLILEGLHAP